MQLVTRGRHRSKFIAIGLVAIAATLVVLFLDYSTQVIVVYKDHTETSSAGEPLVILRSTTADFICLRAGPCNMRARSEIQGVFARAGFSAPAAFVGGVITPFALICAAWYLGCRQLSGLPRILVSGCTILLGTLFLMPPILVTYLAMANGTLSQFISGIDEAAPFLTVLIVGGLTMLCAGIWLACRKASHAN